VRKSWISRCQSCLIIKLTSLSALLQVYRQERVFISHAGPQKGFALHLRTQLRDAGISTFVDERDLLPGADQCAPTIMEAACRRAQLVVFVVTRDFLRRAATLQELRWALDQRQRQQEADASTTADSGPAAPLPRLLTVMYPTSGSASWRVPELRQLLQRELAPISDGVDIDTVAERLNAAAVDVPVDVGELQDGSLSGLLQMYHPAAGVAGSAVAAVTAQQAAADIAHLAATTVVRADSVAR
jgi:TIR domain